MVIRLRLASSVGPTASESMLNPRRAKRPAQRVRTPGRFWTSTLSVCRLIRASKRGLAPFATGPGPFRTRRSYALLHPMVVVLGPLDVDDVGGRAARGHHRVHLLLAVDAGIDHGRAAARERRPDRLVDLFLGLAAERRHAEALGELHVVGQVTVRLVSEK